MTRRRLPQGLAISAMCFVACAGRAAADQPWSAPAPVTGPRTGPPALTFDSQGLGVLAADTGGAAPAVGPHAVGSVFRAGAFSPLATLTPDNVGLSGDIATYAETRTVGLGTHFERTHDRVELLFGRAGGELTDAERVGPTDRHALAESLAADARGDVAGSYGACIAARACGHQDLYLVPRRAGRAPGHSVRIADDATGWLSSVAVDARGDMLVAWQSNGGVYARIRTAGGKLFPAQRIGTPGEPVTAISAVLTPAGAAAVAWSAQNVSEGVPQSPATVDATFRAAGSGHRFHTAQRLASVPALAAGHYVSERHVKLAQAAGGEIAAAWTGYENGRFVVQAAELAGYRFGAAQTVSDPAVDSVLTDLDAASAFAVQWRTGVAGNDPGVGPAGLEAALRAPGAKGFGAAETIEQGAPANNATLRFDPATGNAVAVWSAYATNNLQASVRTPVTP